MIGLNDTIAFLVLLFVRKFRMLKYYTSIVSQEKKKEFKYYNSIPTNIDYACGNYQVKNKISVVGIGPLICLFDNTTHNMGKFWNRRVHNINPNS